MINQINLKSPGLRHSDLKIISNTVEIKKIIDYLEKSLKQRGILNFFMTKHYLKIYIPICTKKGVKYFYLL